MTRHYDAGNINKEFAIGVSSLPVVLERIVQLKYERMVQFHE